MVAFCETTVLPFLCEKVAAPTEPVIFVKRPFTIAIILKDLINKKSSAVLLPRLLMSRLARFFLKLRKLVPLFFR